MNKLLILSFAAIFLFSIISTKAFAIDSDGDGIPDGSDNCIIKSNPTQIDTDGDGFGNACDPDFNNDCIVDITDANILSTHFNTNYPLCDLNSDGIVDIIDAITLSNNFCKVPGPSALSTCTIPDADGDGRGGSCDNCPTVYNPDQKDRDKDGIGDACDDSDNDGIMDNLDNCITTYNPEQADGDGDGYGNMCDADIDNDCVVTMNDIDILINHFNGQCVQESCLPGYSCFGDYSMCYLCSGSWNPAYDIMGSTPGMQDYKINMRDISRAVMLFGRVPGPSALTSTCQVNHDNDGVPDVVDNCPNVYNPLQEDSDGDCSQYTKPYTQDVQCGDVCDYCPLDPENDIDQDTICGNVDNCPTVYNPDQLDMDHDGIGDVCDTCTDTDGDGYGNPGYPANTCSIDYCPYEDATGFDADHNGCIDTITGLTNVINTLPSDVLSDQIKNSLTSKVDNALKSLDKTQDDAAINQLLAFINQVNAQKGKKISEEVADELIAYANNLIAKIRAG